MKHILDRSFQYTPSGQTDLKKTFARIRRMLQEQELAQAHKHADTEAQAQVVTLMPHGKSAVSV